MSKRVAEDRILLEYATVKNPIIFIGLALSLTANIVLATILVVGRVERSADYTDESRFDSSQTVEPLPVPEFPEILTRDSVARYLANLGAALESRNTWSGDDPEGMYIRLLWPQYAPEIADACASYWSLISLLDGAADVRFLPQIDTDTLLKFVELGPGYRFQREVIREVIDRGDEPRLRSLMEDRISAAAQQGIHVFFPEPQARYIIEAGIPIDDSTAVEALRSGGGLAVPLLQHLLRFDPDRATRLAEEAFSSPSLLRNLSHDMRTLILLAEAGVEVAIPIAAESAMEYDRPFIIAALRVLIRSLPPGMSGEAFLAWVAAQPPEAFIYDPATRRYQWQGDQG